jgi:tRNA U54 and U55 pseudouridine synthase Pus10
MKRMKNLFLGAVAAIAVFAFAGCGAVAHIEKDESVNFSAIKTFGFVGEQEKSLKDRHSNSIVDANLKSAVTKELAKYGLKEDKNNPDVLIDYNIMVEDNVKQQSDPVYTRSFTRYFYNPYTRRITPVFYPSQMIGYQNYEIPYKEGTLTLHIIDNDTNKLIWQGWTSDEVNSNNITSKQVAQSVKTIMKKFKTQG